jgi:hypothetical protein
MFLTRCQVSGLTVAFLKFQTSDKKEPAFLDTGKVGIGGKGGGGGETFRFAPGLKMYCEVLCEPRNFGLEELHKILNSGRKF